MTQMSTMKRASVLLALVMAAVLILSAPMAEAKKHKKKKKRPQYNVVQCVGGNCEGTDYHDYLLGSEGFDQILGKEGNDVYNGRGDNDVYDGRAGCDDLIDWSHTSSDYYSAKPDSNASFISSPFETLLVNGVRRGSSFEPGTAKGTHSKPHSESFRSILSCPAWRDGAGLFWTCVAFPPLACS